MWWSGGVDGQNDLAVDKLDFFFHKTNGGYFVTILCFTLILAANRTYFKNIYKKLLINPLTVSTYHGCDTGDMNIKIQNIKLI